MGRDGTEGGPDEGFKAAGNWLWRGNKDDRSVETRRRGKGGRGGEDEGDRLACGGHVRLDACSKSNAAVVLPDKSWGFLIFIVFP